MIKDMVLLIIILHYIITDYSHNCRHRIKNYQAINILDHICLKVRHIFHFLSFF